MKMVLHNLIHIINSNCLIIRFDNFGYIYDTYNMHEIMSVCSSVSSPVVMAVETGALTIASCSYSVLGNGILP